MHPRQGILNCAGLLLALATGGCGFALPTVRTPTRPDGLNAGDDSSYVAEDATDEARACISPGSPRSQRHLDMLTLLNAYRAEHGLSRVGYSRTLQQAADAYAQRLYAEDFFDHVAPDGSAPADRAVAAGFCDRRVGENIAYGLNQLGSAEAALQGFINSPAHNANMLRPEWDYVGIGYLQVTGFTGTEYWWVQLFGTDQAPELGSPRTRTSLRDGRRTPGNSRGSTLTRAVCIRKAPSAERTD